MQSTQAHRLPRFNYPFNSKKYPNQTDVSNKDHMSREDIKEYNSKLLELQNDSCQGYLNESDISKLLLYEFGKSSDEHIEGEGNMKKNNSKTTDSPKSLSQSSGIFSVMISSGENTSDEMHSNKVRILQEQNVTETPSQTDFCQKEANTSIHESVENVENLFYKLHKKFINLRAESDRIEENLNHSSVILKDISQKQNYLYSIVKQTSQSSESPTLPPNDESFPSHQISSPSSSRITSVRRLKQIQPQNQTLNMSQTSRSHQAAYSLSNARNISKSASRLSSNQDILEKRRNPFGMLISKCRKSLENITHTDSIQDPLRSHSLHKSQTGSISSSRTFCDVAMVREISLEKSTYHDPSGHIITTSSNKLELLRNNFKRSVSDFFHPPSKRSQSGYATPIPVS